MIARGGPFRAFERIAPRSDYDTAKEVFDGASALQSDERCIEAIAQAAYAAGRRQDVTSYLARLKKAADERGSWGDGWRGNAKQRYHRLNVLLNGEPARRTAFSVSSMIWPIGGSMSTISYRI